jgi:hypothetical protein
MTKEDYPVSQRDRKQAHKALAKLMDVPTPQEANKIRMDLEEAEIPELTKKLERYSRRAEEVLALETDIHQWDAVKALSWVPEAKNASDNESSGERKKLKGHYLMQVKRADEQIVTIRPANDWVNANFMKDVLGHVQSLGVQASEKYDAKGSAIRLKSHERTASEVPSKWIGYCNQTKEQIVLPEEWVKTNVGPQFMTKVKQFKQQGKFIHLPPGDNKNQSQVALPAHLPELKYRQHEGEDTCLLTSLANGLYYCGHRDAANKVTMLKNKVVGKADAWETLC